MVLLSTTLLCMLIVPLESSVALLIFQHPLVWTVFADISLICPYQFANTHYQLTVKLLWLHRVLMCWEVDYLIISLLVYVLMYLIAIDSIMFVNSCRFYEYLRWGTFQLKLHQCYLQVSSVSMASCWEQQT